MNIILLDSSDWERAEANGAGRDEIRECITGATTEVAKILELPEHLNIMIRPHEWLYIINETGIGGQSIDKELVSFTFHPDLSYGKEALMKSLRGLVFHEMNHVYRWMDVGLDAHMLHDAVAEGLATVFADDYAGADSPWGKYEGEPTEDWLKELATKTYVDFNEYFELHTDGRRWIGYKVGTWLVREAMKNSGKTVIELSRMDWRGLVELAGRANLISP